LEVSEDELEQIVEEKVEKRLQERQQNGSEEGETGSNLSRRAFLKGLAGGAAGIGAASMLPSAAGYQITSNHPLSYYNQSSSDPNFEVNTEGTLDTNQIGTNSNPVGSIHSNTINAERVSSNSVSTENINNKVVVPESASTAADINAVISSVSDGAEIEIPAGEYILNEPITAQGKKGIWLHGQGMFSTVLKVADQTSINAVNIVDTDRWRVSHLQVDGNEANQTDQQEEDGQTGIRLGRSIGSNGSAEWLKVDHCYVHDTVGANFRNTAEGGTVERIYSMFNVAETCRVADIGLPYHNFANTGDEGTINKVWHVCNYGFDSGQIGIELSSGVKEATVIGCHMQGAAQNGYTTQPTSNANITFTSCHAKDIDGSGYLPQAEGVQLHGCVAEGCSGDGIILDGVGQQAHGCISYNNTGRGIKIERKGVGVYGGEYYQNGNSGVRVNSPDAHIHSPYSHDNGGAGVVAFTSPCFIDTPRVYDNSNAGVTTVGGEVNCRIESPIGNGNNGLLDIREDKNWIDGRAAFSYTGDGTTGRTINLDRRPSLVYVEGSDGTLYETRDDSLSAINGTTPSGELSISDTGFSVGDNGADADPNTDTETYQVLAVE